MLSVVVYGRNDTHGYNLHRRTATGLNAIAEVLSATDDEIVFVDYNTPDDYPTLIEAIRDTLTDRCLARLRVLRVRPAVHERWRTRTPYPVLEAVARNVAARRTNPANRWILSTNPDMVFLPRGGARSLTDIVAGLADGFFQVPRFEMPETLWETFDRRNPAATMARLAEWGRRLHINELVHTGPITRFDGIGDFQLILRSDWFAIHGCHEDMIFGSNVDENLCRRLNLLHGTGSLADQVFAFHCGHGRQATLLHADDTRMNDPIRFVDQVESPLLPEQASRWGLAGEEVEEFRADAPPGARYVPALVSVLPGMAEECSEAWNDRDVKFRLRYEPEHALPYLLNHLVNLPRRTTIGWIGGNARMLALFRAAWRRLEGGRLLIAQATPLIVPDDLDPEREETADLERIAREAGVLVFEFGLDDALLCDDEPDRWFARITPERRDALGRLKGSFLHLCARERQRLLQNEAPRKVIAVNAINTYCGQFVEAEIRFVRIPFSCRVQHGFIRPEGAAVFLLRGQSDLGSFLTKALGRTHGMDRFETAIVEADLARLREADPDAVDPRTFSQPLLAALDWPGLDMDAERKASICAAAGRRRISCGLRPLLAPDIAAARRPEGPPALNKLAAAEDWEDAGWFTHAHRYTIDGLSYHASTYNYYKRSRGVWERTQMLYGLQALRPVGPDDRLAVVCGAPDGLPLFLADRAGHVDMIATAAVPHDAPAWLGKRRLFHPDRVTVHRGGWQAPALAGRRWSAVLLPQNVAMADGDAGLLAWLARADAHLDEGGIIAFSCEIALGGMAPGPWTPLADITAMIASVEKCTGLRSTGPFDASVCDTTLDRVATAGGADMEKPHFIICSNHTLHGCGVWFLRKQVATTPEAWMDCQRDRQDRARRA